MSVVFLNGRFAEEEEASVSVADRGFLYGEGVFTTVRVENGRAELLDRHFERLLKSCIEMEIPLPSFSKEVIDQLIERNRATEGVWRLKVVVTAMTLLVTIKPYRRKVFRPLKLILYPSPIVRPLSQVKSLAYIDRFYVQRYALEKGADDAVVVTPGGALIEAAFSNLFWLDGNTLYTPSPSLPILWGVMIDEICRRKKVEGYTIEKVEAKLSDIPESAQLFLCNSLMGEVEAELQRG